MLLVRGKVNFDDVGVDWLTMSELGDGEAIQDIYTSLSNVSRETPKDGKMLGYRGLTFPVEGGTVFYGMRAGAETTEHLLTVSGAGAQLIAPLWGKHGGCPTLRITRCDLQCTVYLPEPEPKLVWGYYEALQADPGYKRSMVGKRELTMYSSSSGDTLYIGRRGSRGSMLRIYDKGFAYGLDLGRLWRFEVEFKRERAAAMWGLVVAGGKSAVVDVVGAFCVEHGGVVLPGERGTGVDTSAQDDGRTIKTMRWLHRCVRPVVWGLVDDGRADEVVDALGLGWLFPQKSPPGD